MSSGVQVNGRTVFNNSDINNPDIDGGTIGGNLCIVKSDETIQSVIDSISGATVSNPYTVFIPPGSYNERVILQDFISLQGAGRKATNINYSHAPLPFDNGTINLGNGCCVSDLSVVSTGTNAGRSFVTLDKDVEFIVNNVYTENTYDIFWISNSHDNITTGYFYNCNHRVGYDGFAGWGTHTKASTLHIFNNDIYMKDAPAGVTPRGIAIGTDNMNVNMYGGRIYGRFSKAAHAYAAHLDTTNSKLKLYDVDIDFENSNTGAYNVSGIENDGGTVEVFSGRVHAGGAVSGNIIDVNNITGTCQLYGTKYTSISGIVTGTQRQQGQSVTLSANGTFGPEYGNVLAVDPGGAARNYNPSGSFTPWTQITIINAADAAETITFDSAGLNQAIAQNERGIFVYDGSAWQKIFVG